MANLSLDYFLPDGFGSLTAEFCPSANPCDDDIWADWVVGSIVLMFQNESTKAMN